MHHPSIATLLAWTTASLVLTACGGGSGTAETGSTAVSATGNATSDCAMTANAFTVPGNTVQIDSVSYAADATTPLFSQQNKFVVKDGANFRGESGLTEIASLSTVTFSSAPDNGSLAGQTIGPIDVKSYVKTVGTANRGYGYVTTSAAGAVTSYFLPPTTMPVAPLLNTEYSQTYTRTTEATSTTPQSQTTLTEVLTFLGVESVAVAAGTFSACKTKTVTTTDGASSTAYKWTVAAGRLKGLTVLHTNASGKKTQEATVLLVNGQ